MRMSQLFPPFNSPMNVRVFSLFTGLPNLTRHSRRRDKKPFHFGIQMKLSWPQTNNKRKEICTDFEISIGELQRIVTVAVKVATNIKAISFFQITTIDELADYYRYINKPD